MDALTPADERDDLQQLEVIAEIGYEAVRALEKLRGEQPSLPWDELSEERRQELEDGVKFILERAASPLSAQHDAWRARNIGRLPKDDPRLVPFDQLSFGLQLKARIWRHIAHAVVG